MGIITGSIFLDALVFILSSLVALYAYFTRNFGYWSRRGVFYIKPTPFVGNFGDLILGRRGMGKVLSDAYQEAVGQPFVGLFALDKPMLLVRDPDLMKTMLVKDFNSFVDRLTNINEEVDTIGGNSLPVLRGDRWKKVRSALTPAFSTAKLKPMISLIDGVADNLITFIEKQLSDGEDYVNVKDACGRYIIDTVASCSLGVDGKCLEEHDGMFRRRVLQHMKYTPFRRVKLGLALTAPHLVRTLRLRVDDPQAMDYIRTCIWDTIRAREESGVFRNDFIDTLMRLRRNEALQMDGDFLVAQAVFFINAGVETSAMSMLMCLYELAHNHDIQDRVRNEIRSVLEKHDGCFTYEAYGELKYLLQVVYETLRKYPPVEVVDREATVSYRIPGTDIILDKGTGVTFSVWGVHWDPTYYPNPEVFDPDRFTEEAKANRHSMAYLAFGDGPKTCIGLRVALMQIQMGIARVIEKYVIFPRPDAPPLHFNKFGVVVDVEGEILMQFRKATKVD